jgi:hypothetical protein
MQFAAAGLFVVEAIFSIVTAAVYVNHDNMLRVMQTVGLDLPPGTNVDTAATAAVVSTWVSVVAIAALEIFAALGSYRSWRWMFWVSLVLLGIGAIGTITGLGSLGIRNASPFPDWALAVDKVLSAAAIALFAWMVVGAIRFGPWATNRRRPRMPLT